MLMHLDVGKSYDFRSLLSTSSFLVRNNGDQVEIESLVGKTIGIYSLPLGREKISQTKVLIDCYNRYNPSGNFEVVLVAVAADNAPDENKDREMFHNCFSKMPWLAIPFDDIESRNRLAQIDFIFAKDAMCTILDPSGRVVTHTGLHCMCEYGTDYFPFTDERFKEITAENRKAWEEDTLTSLLTSPNRDYLVDRKGRKIPARELEGKTVGLYFYTKQIEEGFFLSLTKMYKTLRDRGEKFEIVMIATNSWQRGEIAAFMKAFQEMPWLAWPLSDEKYKRLSSLFFGRQILMIGPNMEFKDEYGFEIINAYGIEAYPFTRKSVAQMRVRKMKEQSLESILMSTGHRHVMTNTGSKVKVSELKGKTVALFIGALSCEDYADVLGKVIESYEQIKKRDDTFEIIFVSWDEDEESYNHNYLKMPWLALSFQKDTEGLSESFQKVFPLQTHEMPLVYAFGSDGRILTRMACSKLLEHGLDAYPFNDEGLVDEALHEVNHHYMWV